MQGSRRTWSSPNTLHVALCLHAANPLAMDETACSSAPLVTCSFGSDVKRLSGLRSPNRKKSEWKRSSRFIDKLSFPKAFRRNFSQEMIWNGDTFKFSWSDTYTYWYHGCKIHRLIQGFHVSVELVELGEPKRARHRGTADKASQNKWRYYPEKQVG